MIAGAILMAGALIAYHPFLKPRPHLQLMIRDDAFVQLDPAPGQVWALTSNTPRWRKAKLLQRPFRGIPDTFVGVSN
jgi:hypothetical protein